MTREGKSERSEPGTANLFVLLVSLLLLLVVVPLFEAYVMDRLLLQIAVTGLLIVGMTASRRRRLIFRSGGMLAVVAIPVAWISFFTKLELLFVAGCVLESSFFVLTAVWLLVYVARQPQVTVQSIFGAISAYLLLGLAWAMLYWAVDRSSFEHLDFAHKLAIQGPSWQEAEVARFSQLVYFSFVTMSTLGYGDIVPRTPIAQTLAWTQSVLGQFYLAILVARLVSALPRRRTAES